MELRTLRYFVAVAEELHFGRAAQRVNIAQPPLSYQIRKLEEELGAQLFTRTKRRVSLTQRGEFLLQSARLILRQADAAIAGVRAAGVGLVGQLSLGLINAMTFRGDVFNVLREFRKQSPGVAVSLKILTSVEQVRALKRRAIDIGFLRLPMHDRALRVEPIFREELLVALPRGHRLATARAIAVADLADEPFVMLPGEMGFGLFNQVIKLCRQAGFTPKVAQEASELQTMSGLVAAGFGVCLIPSLARVLPREQVIYKPLRPKVDIEIAAAYSADEPAPPAALFLDLLRKQVCK